jgi:hypothetical protein
MRSNGTLRAALRRGAFAFILPILVAGRAVVTQPTLELIVPDTVTVGDTVEIVLRLRNDTPAPLDLELAGRPVGFDIVITGPGECPVWRRLDGEVVASALMLLTLAPGETRDFVARWDQVDGGGRQVPPGRYGVRGYLPLGRGRTAAPARELVIRPG